MKKNYKRIFMYGIVMFVCVVLIVITGWSTHRKIDIYENTYQNMMDESQAALRLLEEENAELKKENKELQTKITQEMSENSDMTTQSQALADLINIYELYKSGKTNEAVAEFKKIEPMGFDDATLAYYEILKDILEK